jgi:hypothetical protein
MKQAQARGDAPKEVIPEVDPSQSEVIFDVFNQVQSLSSIWTLKPDSPLDLFVLSEEEFIMLKAYREQKTKKMTAQTLRIKSHFEKMMDESLPSQADPPKVEVSPYIPLGSSPSKKKSHFFK